MGTGLKLSKLPFIDCVQAVEILQNTKKDVAFIDVRNRKTYVQQFAFGAVHCSLDVLTLLTSANQFGTLVAQLVRRKLMATITKNPIYPWRVFFSLYFFFHLEEALLISLTTIK